LKKWIKNKYPNYINRVLRNLDNEVKIHNNALEKKNKITRKGIDYVENNLLKKIYNAKRNTFFFE